MPPFGQALRDLRRERQVSLRELERRVPVSRSHLSDLERGHRRPTPDIARILDDALAGGGQLAGMVTTPEVAEMERREIIGGLAAMAVGAAATTWLASGEALRRLASLAMDLGPGDWQGIVAEYLSGYYAAPPAETIERVSADLLVLRQVGAPRSADRRELRRTGAQLATVMALALADTGRHREASRWYVTAREAGDACGDLAVRAWVRGHEAIASLYGGRGAAGVVALADEGLAVGPPPCRGTMHLLAARAQAYAVLGAREEAQRALEGLEAAYATLPPEVTRDVDDLTTWQEHRLHHVRSYVATHLGWTREAYAAQDRALELYSPAQRANTALIHVHRGWCQVRDGHHADGVSAVCAALDGLPWDRRGLPHALAGSVLAALPAGDRRGRELRDRLTSPDGVL